MYGIINDPPPLEYNTFGNRHIFPNPTAEPIIAKINVRLLFHSLFFSFAIFHHLVNIF